MKSIFCKTENPVRRMALLSIFENLFRVWLHKRQLDSRICLCSVCPESTAIQPLENATVYSWEIGSEKGKQCLVLSYSCDLVDPLKWSGDPWEFLDGTLRTAAVWIRDEWDRTLSGSITSHDLTVSQFSLCQMETIVQPTNLFHRAAMRVQGVIRTKSSDDAWHWQTVSS